MSFTAVVSGETAGTARGLLREAAEHVLGRPVRTRRGGLPRAGGNDRTGGCVYLLVTGNAVRDVPVPGRHHRPGMPQLAGALGDARDARAAGRPVVRPHPRGGWAGLARLLDAAGGVC